MKSHSNALVFFAVSKQISVVYSADRGRAEEKKKKEPTPGTGTKIQNQILSVEILVLNMHVSS